VRLHPLLFAFCLTLAKAAFADPCGHPDLLETFPPDGATDVPINARLSARYASTAEYVDEDVTLEHVGVGIETPRATFDASEGFLSFEPAAPLVPGDAYVVRWPSLRGLTTAVAGKGAEVTFTVGATSDVDPPLFGGVRAVSWDVERVNDECTDALEDRFVFDLALDDVTDDGGKEMITLLVFQSKGGSATTSPAPILAQHFPEKGANVRVQRSIDSAAGNVCFAALARDSSARVSNSANREVCVHTVKPPFFYGCAVARASAGSQRAAQGGSAIFLALLASIGVRRRKRGPARVVMAAGFIALGGACWSCQRSDARRGISSDEVDERRAAAPPAASFVCAGDRCVKRYPRLPDDGEWSCDDTAGVAVCSGGEPPSGVPINVVDAAWTCGQRSAGAGKPGTGERVCVDYVPDFPNGEARGWRCHYVAEASLARICERDVTAHVIGDPCDARNPCLDGLRCSAGRCAAALPSPSCVIDADCDKAVCRFGSCWSGPT
jgi:hypothetical protein